jgi:hypothetical protein
VDISLNNQMYTKPFAPSSRTIILTATPTIISISPNSGPMSGSRTDPLHINANNIYFRSSKVTCKFAETAEGPGSITRAYWDTRTDPYCIQDCQFTCQIPYHTAGNVSIFVSANSLSYYGSAIYSYDPCESGFVSSAPQIACSLCSRGKYASDDQASCLQCALNTFSNQPGAQGSCTECPDHSYTLQGKSTNLTECLCIGYEDESPGYYKLPTNGLETCLQSGTCVYGN